MAHVVFTEFDALAGVESADEGVSCDWVGKFLYPVCGSGLGNDDRRQPAIAVEYDLR